MKSPENRKNLEGKEEKQEKRRNFLKGLGAGIVAGIATGLGVNKYIQNEKELNAFYKEFGPDADVDDIDKVASASKILREEILKYDTSTEVIINKAVKLIGTEHPNYKIDILRDYIRRHLSSRSSKENPLSEKILKKGFITINDLDTLSAYLKSEPKISH